MIELLLTVLVVLIVLALIVWIARAVLAGLGAPAWLFSVVAGVACIVAVVVVARALGVAVP